MSSWYAIVDCAADPRLYELVADSANFACLFEDDYDDETRRSLPYLVTLRDGERLPTIWREHESGRFWGLVCRSDLELKALRRHFRKFTTARLPLGEFVLFRFWDPRVFAVYMENGTPEEVAPFFRPLEAVIADLGKGGRRRYSWDGGLLYSDLQQPEMAG